MNVESSISVNSASMNICRIDVMLIAPTYLPRVRLFIDCLFPKIVISLTPPIIFSILHSLAQASLIVIRMQISEVEIYLSFKDNQCLRLRCFLVCLNVSLIEEWGIHLVVIFNFLKKGSIRIYREKAIHTIHQNSHIQLFDKFQSMKIVLKYNTQVKLYPDDIQYDKIIAFALRQFSLLKDSICLTFHDQQGDDITLLSNQDIQIMQAVFQGKQYVKVNIQGIQTDLTENSLTEVKSKQPLTINQSIVQSQLLDTQPAEIHYVCSEGVAPQSEKHHEHNKEHGHRGQGHCGERRKEKFAKMSCYMNELVAKLVDQRIKLLLPCIKEQMMSGSQKIEKASELVHDGFQCKGCLQTPIAGIRYECPKCPDFNLCENCEEKIQHDHNLLKVKKVQHKQEQKKNLSRWQNCFKKFFDKRHGRSSSHSRGRDHRRGGHYMRKLFGLSYIFGGQPDNYKSFVEQNQDLLPRQTFKEYAKKVNMPEKEFTNKYISLRCLKLSRCFGKPAESYRAFVAEHIELRQRDMMEVLYEKGIEKRQNNRECDGGRKYRFNEHCYKEQKEECNDKKQCQEKTQCEEKKQCKQECGEKKEVKQKKEKKQYKEKKECREKKQESPKTRQKIFCFNEEKQQKIQISESMLREPKPLDTREVAKAKGALFMNMQQIFTEADKKELVKFIDQHYSEGNQDQIINMWVQKQIKK